MSYTYVAYLSINDTVGRSLNFSDTPTVTVWDGRAEEEIETPSPTLTNITTGLYSVKIELATKTDVLFKVVPHVDDEEDIADIKVIHEGYIETVGELAKPGDAMTLADGAITADKFASNAITADKIASNAITDAKIASGAITDAKIATDAFSAAKFKAEAVTKIQNGLAKATDIPSVSDIATAVWGAVTRTLTSGLITVQQIWENATRTLTASPTDTSNLATKEDVESGIEEVIEAIDDKPVTPETDISNLPTKTDLEEVKDDIINAMPDIDISTIPADILNKVVVDDMTVVQVLKVLSAVEVGTVTGGGGATFSYIGKDGTKITLSGVDEHGNRGAVNVEFE